MLRAKGAGHRAQGAVQGARGHCLSMIMETLKKFVNCHQYYRQSKDA